MTFFKAVLAWLIIAAVLVAGVIGATKGIASLLAIGVIGFVGFLAAFAFYGCSTH